MTKDLDHGGVADRLAAHKFKACTCPSLRGEGWHEVGCLAGAIDDACAVLRALPETAAVEPVAHRYRDHRPPVSEWMNVLTPGDLEYLLGRPEVYEVQPLYASPPDLQARLAEVEKERDGLRAKMDPEHTCACAFDHPDDVCLIHSPQLTAAKARIAVLERALGEVVNDYDQCSGAEPSLSILHRSIDVTARSALPEDDSHG